MKKLIHSPAPWFTELYANSYFIQTEEGYSESNVFDLEFVGEDIAQTNAVIACKAPDMYKALFGVLHHNDNVKEDFKLPKSLIEQISSILTDIETYKKEMNT